MGKQPTEGLEEGLMSVVTPLKFPQIERQPVLANPKASVDEPPEVGPQPIDLVGVDTEVFILVCTLLGTYRLGKLPPLVANNLMVPTVFPSQDGVHGGTVGEDC